MRILGTELYDKGFDQLISDSLQILEGQPKNLLISPADANVLVTAKLDADFAKILHEYHWNLPDGVPSVWMLKWKGAKHANRCSGPDYFKSILETTAKKDVKHYLCGGAPRVAEALKLTCQQWGNHQVVGTLCPPFKALSEQEIIEIADDINAKSADVVWVGLGAPKQIYFAHRLAKYTQVKLIVTIGAAFDFHTGRVKKAPDFIQKMGLEWLYRLVREPKRLTKRYFKIVPLFIFFNLLEIKSFLSKSSSKG
jgi:N-acetylglucosaminyldiphosphoundecaprenol N-acetyl-beta-D-mannosaminyltransferase